jgi:integrase
MQYTTFQRGTLVKIDSAKGGFTWKLRYRKDGQLKSMTIGTSDELPTEKDARRKAATLSAVINEDTPAKTFSQLCERYIADELPSRPQTAASYKSAMRHLRAKFDDMPLDKMLKDLMSIKAWISDLQSFPIPGAPARPLSMKSKQNIKACLHRLINCAMMWGYIDVQANPIALVEIKKPKFGKLPPKRLKTPLTPKQVRTLLMREGLSDHVKVMITLCVFNGLRISEVLGLRWEDVDFHAENGPVISIMRSSVGKHVDETKSDASQSTMPMHPHVAQVLASWKASSTSFKGWVFENEVTGRPFHRDSLQTDHLAPAGKAIGINNLGWHSFRHSFRAFQRDIGTAPETQKLVMRHANLSTTMEYGVDDELLEVKRPAINAVAEMLLKDGEK